MPRMVKQKKSLLQERLDIKYFKSGHSSLKHFHSMLLLFNLWLKQQCKREVAVFLSVQTVRDWWCLEICSQCFKTLLEYLASSMNGCMATTIDVLDYQKLL